MDQKLAALHQAESDPMVSVTATNAVFDALVTEVGSSEAVVTALASWRLANRKKPPQGDGFLD